MYISSVSAQEHQLRSLFSESCA